MQYKIIQNIEDFKVFNKTWLDLYEKGDCTPFQSFAWNYEWYIKQYANHSLFIVSVFEKEQSSPCLIAPFMINSAGLARFIADTHSDYSNFLVESSMKNSKLYDALKTLKKAIDKSNEVTAIELKNIKQTNPLMGIFMRLFDEKKIFFQSNACSYIRLQPKKSFFDCFDYLTSKQRSELKRLFKKNPNLVYIRHTVHTSPFPRSTLIEIVQEMRQKGIRDKNFLGNDLLNVIEALYNEGLLTIMELKNQNGETLALNLLLVNEKEKNYLFWIDLYKDIPFINLSSYLYLFKYLCENLDEAFTVDFGRGLYDYKIKNFLPNIETQFTFFFSKNNTQFVRYLFKTFFILSIKNFYKQHKSTINRLLRR